MPDNCTIREYETLTAGGPGTPMPVAKEPPLGTPQRLEVTTGGVVSAVFHHATRVIWVSSEVAGLIEFGDDPALSAGARKLVAEANAEGGGQWFGVRGGMRAILLEGTTLP